MHEEFEFIATQNGYPTRFIKAQMRKTLGRYFDKINGTQIFKSGNKNKNKIKNNKDNSIKKQQVFLDIPYYGKLSEQLAKQLINLANEINPQVHIQPTLRPISSISKYFSIKDPIPKLLQSNVAYELKCDNCEAVYIGKTIRQTYRRLQEQGANFDKDINNKSEAINLTNNSIKLRRSDRNKRKIIHYFPEVQHETSTSKNKNITNSAVKQHELNNNHKIDWYNYNIVAADNKHYRLLIKESLLISKYKPSLNRTTCSAPLIVFPEGLETKKPKVKIKSTKDAPPGGANQYYERS